MTCLQENSTETRSNRFTCQDVGCFPFTSKKIDQVNKLRECLQQSTFRNLPKQPQHWWFVVKIHKVWQVLGQNASSLGQVQLTALEHVTVFIHKYVYLVLNRFVPTYLPRNQSDIIVPYLLHAKAKYTLNGRKIMCREICVDQHTY